MLAFLAMMSYTEGILPQKGKNMKKLITLALALLIAALALTACTNHNHSKYDNDSTYHWLVCDSENCADEGAKEYHSYNDFRFNASGDKEYTCTVCGYVYTEAHTHNYSEWSSNAGKHWQICTAEGCTKSTAREDHSFSFTKVTKEPALGEAGEELYTCVDCGRTKTQSLPALPDKMSESEWKNSFLFDNVRVDYISNCGDLGQFEGYRLIDGELILDVMDEEETYFDRSILSDMDFSDYYSYFTNEGNGVYKAENVYVSEDGFEIVYDEIMITFEDGKIASIIYSIDMGESFGTWLQGYYYSMWDEVTVEEPTPAEKMSEEDWIAAFELENLVIDYSLSSEDIDFYYYGYYVVMGDVVYDVCEDMVFETDRSELSVVDFADYYDFFTVIADGMYYAESLTASEDGYKYELTEVEIWYDEEGLPYYISYCIDMGEDIGNLLAEYILYDWGEAGADDLPEEEDTSVIEMILDRDNFINYYVDERYNKDQMIYRFAYYDFDGADYSICKTDEWWNETTEEGTYVNAGLVKCPGVTLLLSIDPADFIGEGIYNANYVYAGDASLPKNFDGLGNSPTGLFFETDDYGNLSILVITLDNGDEYEYHFYLYGD